MATRSAPSIFSLLTPYKTQLILSSLLSVVATVLGLVPFVLVYLIAVSLFNPPIDHSQVWQLIFISLIAIVVRSILLGIVSSISHVVAYNVLYDIRIRISEKLGTLPLGYFDQHSTGQLKKVMNEDIENTEIFIAHGIPELTGIISTFLITTLYLLTVDWRLTLASLAGVPVTLLAMVILFKDTEPLMAGYYAVQDRLNGTIIEYIQGMPVIKAFTQTTESFAQYQHGVREYQQWEENFARKLFFPFTLLTSSSLINLLAILPLGMWLLNQNQISMPTFLLFLLLGLGLSGLLVKFTDAIHTLEHSQEGAKRIFNILNEPALAEPVQSLCLQGLTLEFRQVYFSYQNPDQAINQDKQVLQGISFVIPQGSVTALVGPSGSGKTTIARLIARFWEVNSGEICLGGVNIKDLRLADLMSNIAFVLQDVVLFHDTVYENIGLGNPHASPEAVIAAAKAARCHEFIEALPEGYQTVVGERGATLSGGQRQRISIARAILKDAPIVVLDEATAFIDPENEAQIQASISKLVQGKTLLMIAHRLSTIVEADQIIVLDHGRISGQGSHDKLLETNALYRQMWSAHLDTQQWEFTGEQSVFKSALNSIS